MLNLFMKLSLQSYYEWDYNATRLRELLRNKLIRALRQRPCRDDRAPVRLVADWELYSLLLNRPVRHATHLQISTLYTRKLGLFHFEFPIRWMEWEFWEYVTKISFFLLEHNDGFTTEDDGDLKIFVKWRTVYLEARIFKIWEFKLEVRFPEGGGRKA